MTIQAAYRGVELLLPARVHQARKHAAAALVAELSATIAALPTASTVPHAGDDPDLFKAWASRMICNLPTQTKGDSDYGTR